MQLNGKIVELGNIHTYINTLIDLLQDISEPPVGVRQAGLNPSMSPFPSYRRGEHPSAKHHDVKRRNRH